MPTFLDPGKEHSGVTLRRACRTYSLNPFSLHKPQATSHCPYDL